MNGKPRQPFFSLEPHSWPNSRPTLLGKGSITFFCNFGVILQLRVTALILPIFPYSNMDGRCSIYVKQTNDQNGSGSLPTLLSSIQVPKTETSDLRAYIIVVKQLIVNESVRQLLISRISRFQRFRVVYLSIPFSSIQSMFSGPAEDPNDARGRKSLTLRGKSCYLYSRERCECLVPAPLLNSAISVNSGWTIMQSCHFAIHMPN